MSGLARLKTPIIALLALVAFALPAAPSFAVAKRLALVIGNNAYTDGVLKNPINDARSMAVVNEANALGTTWWIEIFDEMTPEKTQSVNDGLRLFINNFNEAYEKVKGFDRKNELFFITFQPFVVFSPLYKY